MEITTNEQAKELIKKWLTENHHQVSDVKDENANFHLEIDYPQSTMKRQRIIQPKEYPSMVLILNGVAIAPEHLEKMKKMSEDDRETFYSEIRRELLFIESSYDINMDEEGIAKQVQFSNEFYFDGLTKTQLFKALLMNYRTLMYIVTKFNDKFGVPVMANIPAPPEKEMERQMARA
jgi:hypothetical protein